ncbi:MAG: PH domain-containing protein [Candidatus Caccosoma sp.]|nr:PH domain-containing protein [Candidatus Caccosoma sp.]
MQYKKLNQKIKAIWLIRNIFVALVLLVLFILFYMNILSNEVNDIVNIVLIILLSIIEITLIIWPFLYFNNYSYGYDDKRIIINYGVIFRHHIVVPVRQLQDLHLYATPLMLIFKIDGMIISTAGSNFTITGIKKDDGEVMISDFEKLLNERLDANNE